MSPEHAREILSAHTRPGEAWPLHCLQVARVTLALGDALANAGVIMDLDDLESQALLHDLGRSRTHGPFHGWTGFLILRSLGHARAGRGCLTHWLKGRSSEEVLRAARFRPAFVARLYEALEPPGWTLADSVLSVADSSVRHSTVVPFDERHDDLERRYGPSPWIRRARELTAQHATEVAARLGHPLEPVLAPLYGDTLA